MLAVSNLRFTYHDTSPDKKYGDLAMQFDLTVNDGEILSIIGPSGSGKTTLLNLIAGFNQAESGQILVDGNDISHLPIAKRPVTTVFQAHNLFPHLDVFTNIAIGIKPSLRLSKSDKERVFHAMQNVGIQSLEHRLPKQLSGGQRQRVALARALVREQKVLLLDEPLAALGPAMREEIIDLIKQLVSEKQLSALFVSHQPDDARIASKQLAFIYQGKVLAVGDSQEMLDQPTQPEIKAYLGG